MSPGLHVRILAVLPVSQSGAAGARGDSSAGCGWYTFQSREQATEGEAQHLTAVDIERQDPVGKSCLWRPDDGAVP